MTNSWTSSYLCLQHAGKLVEGGGEVTRFFGRVMQQPELAGATQGGDALEDVLGGLFAETGQRRQASFPGRGLEIRKTIDAKPLVDQPDLGYAEAADGQHVHQAWRDLFPQVLQQGRVPRSDYFADDLHRGGTDPLALCQAAVIDGVLDRLGEPVHRPGGSAERTDLVN